MAAFVFDASAVVKRYLKEIGCGWIHGLADPAALHELFLTRIARVEVVAAGHAATSSPLPLLPPSSLNSVMMPPTSTTFWK